MLCSFLLYGGLQRVRQSIYFRSRSCHGFSIGYVFTRIKFLHLSFFHESLHIPTLSPDRVGELSADTLGELPSNLTGMSQAGVEKFVQLSSPCSKLHENPTFCP